METDAYEQARATVEEWIKNNLTEALAELERIKSGEASNQLIVDVAIKANELINLMTGPDDELYEKYRIRVFEDKDGHYDFIHGIEIDVDPLGWEDDDY